MFFASLWSLFLTVPATIVAGALFRQAWLNYRASTDSYGERSLINHNSSFVKARSYLALSALALGGLVCADIGLARPKAETETAQFPRGTVDVICVSDVSRSMAAQDYAGQTRGEALAGGTRLDMARQIIRDKLIPTLNSNQLGLVSFAGEAFDQAYPTDDYRALSYVVEHDMVMGSARGEGANIEAALKMALHYIDVDSDPSRHRLLIIFSDGGFDEESTKFSQILAELEKRQVKVLLVGLGGRSPVAIPVKQLSARDQYFMPGKTVLQMDGQTQLTARDDAALVKMAQRLKARYIRLDSMADFQLEPEDFELVTQTRRAEEDLYRLPVLLAFAAIFVGQLCLLAPAALLKSRREKQS